MGHYEDRDGEFMYIPFDDIQGETKKKADGSIQFKMLGGPYHDQKIRVFAPYDEVRFPCGATYELHPPLNMKKSNKWKFVFNPMLVFGIPVSTESEA